MNVIFVGTSHLGQFDLNNCAEIFNKWNVSSCKIICMPGASIKGLSNPHSTTGLNKSVMNIDDDTNTKILIFQLGQVDIEFGYYYKSVLRSEKLDVDEFMNDLIDKYTEFLLSIKSKVVVIGVNPTAITDLEHTFRVNFNDTMCHANNLIQETGCLDNRYKYSELGHIYNDDMSNRNIVHKRFNEKLKNMCNKYSFVFCDLWDFLIDQDANSLLPIYKPAVNDHHIVPSNILTDHLLKYIRENI